MAAGGSCDFDLPCESVTIQSSLTASASDSCPSAFGALSGGFCLRITVIGCGYVGLVTGACLAEAGHEVVCSDIDGARIAQLQAGRMPIFELHLEEILASTRKAGRISFTPDAGEAIRGSETIFICVGTPPRESGEADLSAIDHVARQIATEARSPKLVIEKSTVPALTGIELRRAITAYTRNGDLSFRVASNPEFL